PRHVHDNNHGNQGAGTWRRPARNDRVSSKENVQGRAAPDRCASVRSSHSTSARFAASRGAGANGAQLSGSQKPALGNRSADEIFLGRVAYAPHGGKVERVVLNALANQCG